MEVVVERVNSTADAAANVLSNFVFIFGFNGFFNLAFLEVWSSGQFKIKGTFIVAFVKTFLRFLTKSALCDRAGIWLFRHVLHLGNSSRLHTGVSGDMAPAGRGSLRPACCSPGNPFHTRAPFSERFAGSTMDKMPFLVDKLTFARLDAWLDLAGLEVQPPAAV
jgi:hypothetical protein